MNKRRQQELDKNEHQVQIVQVKTAYESQAREI